MKSLSFKGKLLTLAKNSLKSTPFRTFSTSEDPTVTIQLPPWQGVDLDLSTLPKTTTTTKSELLKYFAELTAMRRMEFESDNLYKAKMIRGFCHLYIGQESVAVGMEEGLTKEDCIITAYREHCNYMARGDTPYRIIAEMMGKATGSTKAKGGSMHYYSKKNNFYGGNGIVGAQIAVGTGLAFALKYLNKPYACFALYGDGSSNQGQLFEASNMAGVWKLPIVYVIENNKYGMGTSIERASHHTELHSKFRSFPGLEIDGMNVFAVREAVKFCKEYVIKNGPMFLNIDTYRYQGHSMSDPGVTYRTNEEVAKTRETRDCISKVRNYILENKLASEEEIKNIEKSIKYQLLDDIEKIKKDPVPDDSEVTADVYVEKDFPYIRGVQHHLSVFNDHKQ